MAVIGAAALSDYNAAEAAGWAKLTIHRATGQINQGKKGAGVEKTLE